MISAIFGIVGGRSLSKGAPQNRTMRVSGRSEARDQAAMEQEAMEDCVTGICFAMDIMEGSGGIRWFN